MPTINLSLKENSYKIFVKKNIFSDIVSNHIRNYKKSKAIIITDINVANYYLKELTQLFKKKNIKTQSIILKAGEKTKDLAIVNKISERLLEMKINRNDIIYALGGGVIGDFSGFLASIILRGIRYIQIPTTLLSQVDSSVGGKTGVNTKSGKNLIGSFYQPSAVFIDPRTLMTLSEKEFLSGYSEVLKYSLINDKKFFLWLDLNYKKIISRQPTTMIKIIVNCCKKKSQIVKKDEKEKNFRMLLNLGHTFAHAIEKELKYKVRHGEAVSVGLLMALRLSVLLKKTTINNYKLIESHLEKIKLPTTLKLLNARKNWKSKNLFNNMLSDKKKIGNNIKFILLKEIGKAYIESNVSKSKVTLTIKDFIDD